jgi:hypothetical protein
LPVHRKRRRSAAEVGQPSNSCCRSMRLSKFRASRDCDYSRGPRLTSFSFQRNFKNPSHRTTRPPE